MNERLQQVVQELEDISRDARETFGGLSAEQLNWKPSPDSWSIAQCLDHLIRTVEQFYPEFDKIATGIRRNTFWQSYSPFTGMGGRFLINSLRTDSKKVKTPSKAIVPPSEIDAGIVDRFIASNQEVIEKIKATAGADWKKTVVSSPFLSLMTYTIDDAYTVQVEHEKRHLRQAKRVMSSAGFPASASLRAAETA
jgi:hypothetical protein